MLPSLPVVKGRWGWGCCGAPGSGCGGARGAGLVEPAGGSGTGGHWPLATSIPFMSIADGAGRGRAPLDAWSLGWSANVGVCTGVCFEEFFLFLILMSIFLRGILDNIGRTGPARGAGGHKRGM